MGNKVSKISFNGITLDVNDPDAINVQPSSEVKTILAHNTSEWECETIPDAIELQDSIHTGVSRLHPISIGAVRDEIERIDKEINSDDIVYLTYSFNASNNKVTAKASDKNGYEVEIKDKLEILVFSLKSKYDQSTETYTFDHFLGKITINTSEVINHNFEGSITLEQSQQDRVLYFVVLNPVGVSGQYRVSTNDILFANNSVNTITLSSSNGNDDTSILHISFSTNLTDTMKIKITEADGRFGEYVKIHYETIYSGDNTKDILLDPSGYKRTISFEIIEDGNNPVYNVVNNNLVINPRINTRILLFYRNPSISGVVAQVLNGNYAGLQDKITRKSYYDSDFINASDFSQELPLNLKLYASIIPSPGYMTLNGAGQTDETIQAIVDAAHPHAEDNSILFEGNNIYYLDNCNFGEFIISQILGQNVDITNAIFNCKYFVDETLDSDNTQYEIWFVDKNGYLQTCYKNPLYYI